MQLGYMERFFSTIVRKQIEYFSGAFQVKHLRVSNKSNQANSNYKAATIYQSHSAYANEQITKHWFGTFVS